MEAIAPTAPVSRLIPKVNPNAVLAVVAVAQFMVILDGTVVNVALPTVQGALGFSDQNLSWVLNAYTLMFGGFLLLGGRLADRLGRRRLFVAGIALFSGASLVCGLAQSEGMLLVARGAQGLGGAMVSPAALSIILTSFAEGPERNRALAVWGAIAGAGGAIGLLLGGVMVEALSWRWVFFINVPIGAALMAVAPRVVPESRSESGARGGYDVGGALAITLGTMALVFTLIKADGWGWGSGQTVAGFAIAAALIVTFVAIERRHDEPLVPLGIFKIRSLAASDGAMLLLAAGTVRNVLLLHALPAASPRLQRVGDRPSLSAVQRHAHWWLGRRLPTGRPLHAEAGVGDRPARFDGRLPATHARHRRRRLREPRAAGGSRPRRRTWALVRPDHDRRHQRRTR